MKDKDKETIIDAASREDQHTPHEENHAPREEERISQPEEHASHKEKRAPREEAHRPRPVKPEDESYGELMMRFTAHPVKPKYWFEEFGDHWTCSCGQINKGDRCANCGLERDLLRKLFILHKPSPDGTPPVSPSTSSPGSDDNPADANASRKSPVPEGSGSGTEDGAYDEENDTPSSSGLVISVIIAILLLLMGTGAFLYFVFLPEMQAQTAAKQDSVRISLTEALPVATVPLPKAQYKAYIAAGDMLCDRGKYVKSLNYYNKAADLKDDAEVREKILSAKFSYLKAHQNEGGEYFETFLNELVDAHYDGARAIYDSYYSWNVSIVANNIKDDFSTDMENVNRSDTIYFHTTVTGGPPDDSLRVYYQVLWPDGTAETKDVDSRWKAGSHFSTRFQYAMPIFSKAGKLTFEVYDKDSHDLLGTDSIMLNK